MRCKQARPLFSAYLDGAVSGAEMHGISEHLDRCHGCRGEYALMESTRTLVSRLGSKQAPPDLALQIRVLLSGERSRGLRPLLLAQLVEWQHTFRSLVLPAAAGVVTAIFVFTGLIGFLIPPQVDASNDRPTMLYMPPRQLSSISVNDLNLDSPMTIETSIDATGQVQDYRIISGRYDAQTRERLNRALLFTKFAPAQAFGRPVPGKVVISFSYIQRPGN
jgi:hypothetical protein